MICKPKIAVAVINDKDEILLIQEKIRKKPLPLWNLIKGSYGNNKQETIFETALRECQEEVNVSVQLTETLGTFIAQDKNSISVIFAFTAKITNGTPAISSSNEQKIRNEDISELKWFSKEQISKMEKNNFISNRIYSIINCWLNNEYFSLDAVKQVKM